MMVRRLSLSLLLLSQHLGGNEAFQSAAPIIGGARRLSSVQKGHYLIAADDDFDLSEFAAPKNKSKNKSASSKKKSSLDMMTPSSATNEASSAETSSSGSSTKKSEIKTGSNEAGAHGASTGVATTIGINTTMTTAAIPTTGIGGKDGFVYDVNKLKTNLVQRAVSDYKRQLWDLLGTPEASQDAIEEKLAALCQANPVYTTTDSNLLEGKWSTVFSSNKPAQVLLDDARFGVNYKHEKSDQGGGKITHGGSSRHFILEDLELSQDPFVVDKERTIFGSAKYYRVSSLTRQSLDLVLFRKSFQIFGYPLWVKRYRTVMASQLQQTTIQVQILYLDSDLCITVNQPVAAGKSGSRDNQQPFTVYTKSPAWVARTQQMKRKFRRIRSSLNRMKRRLMKERSEFEEAVEARNAVLNDDSMWLEYNKGDTKVRIVKLGDYTERNEPAWEGETDPFNHLSPLDRQQAIKKMEIGEIDAMGKEKIAEVKRTSKKKTGKRLNLKRQMKFEKPASDD
jgi:hypothetical protein